MFINTSNQNWIIFPDNKEEYKSQGRETNIGTISMPLSMSAEFNIWFRNACLIPA